MSATVLRFAGVEARGVSPASPGGPDDFVALVRQLYVGTARFPSLGAALRVAQVAAMLLADDAVPVRLQGSVQRDTGISRV